MGINMKGIFKDDQETLVLDRRSKAIRGLIKMLVVVIILIAIGFVVLNWQDKDKVRRDMIIQDMMILQDAVKNKAMEHNLDPENVTLIGSELSNNPQNITTNGVTEQYRYGYYLLQPDQLLKLAPAVNSRTEYYIVNYDTFDVINFKGVKYNKLEYHTYEDMMLIKAGKQPPVRQIIRSAKDLEKIRSNPNGYFKLSGNLDMSVYTTAEGWEPIDQFNGTLDGRGYTIKNLKIHRPSTDTIGLFKNVNSTARITNLKFENVDIQGAGYVGVLAGSCAGSVSYVKVLSGTVNGNTNYTGGLVGSLASGTISNCTVKLERISANSYAGGLVGMMYSGTLQQSKATTTILGTESLGGAVGWTSVVSPTTIRQVAADTRITGNKDMGGIIGKIDTSSSEKFILTDTYAKGTINGSHTNGGGLIGSVRCVSDGNISLTYLYADIDIVDTKGATTGGGIGYTDIAVTSAVKLKDCFWEKDIAPGETLDGIGSKAQGTFILSCDSKTPEQMKIRSTYTNWDFVEIWAMNERYGTPYLMWEKR